MLGTPFHRRTPTLTLPGVLFAVVFLAAGCTTIGPRMMRSDRFDYGQELARSWEEQMLLNLVKLRYRDTPAFLEITSVSATYTRSLSGTAGGVVSRGGDAAASLEANVGWEESPTVTYTPLAGEDFVRRLMQPLPLETIFLLPQNGWSIERVLRCCVQRLGGVLNAPGAAGPTPGYEPVYQDFHRLAEILRELQIARLLEFEMIEEEQRLTETTTQAGIDSKTITSVRTETETQPAATTKRFIMRILPPAEVSCRNPAADGLLEARSRRASCLVQELEKLLKPSRETCGVEPLRASPTACPNLSDEAEYEPRVYELALSGESGACGSPLGPSAEPPVRPLTLEILPRSLLGVLFFLSQGVAVTGDDIATETGTAIATATRDQQGSEHRRLWSCQAKLESCGKMPEEMEAECRPENSGPYPARCTSDGEAEGGFPWREVTGELIQICNRAEPPENAFVRVRHRGRWFYIADSDLASKSTFGLLTQLFALQSGEKAGLAPLPTLNVGG